MNTTTPHAAAIELLTREAEALQRKQIILDRNWRKAIAQPPRAYSPADVDAAQDAVNKNRDLTGRLRESIGALQTDQAARAAQQAERDAQLPTAAGEAIKKFFIERPEALDITGSEYLGHGQWNVDAHVQYAGTTRVEPRSFLLVRTPDFRLLVNP
jgi:hypothetical protein